MEKTMSNTPAPITSPITAATGAARPVAAIRPTARERFQALMRSVGMLPVLVLLVIAFGIMADGFVSAQNFSIIAQQASINIVLAAGMTFVILNVLPFLTPPSHPATARIPVTGRGKSQDRTGDIHVLSQRNRHRRGTGARHRRRPGLQFGKDASAVARGANAFQFSPDSQRMWRVVEQVMVQPSSRWSMMATALYEQSRINPAGGTEVKQSWMSAGFRTYAHWSHYLSSAVELGHDQIRYDGGANDGLRPRLTKLTVAPLVIKAGPGFSTRPELRVFATFAKWNKPMRWPEATSLPAATSPATRASRPAAPSAPRSRPGGKSRPAPPFGGATSPGWPCAGPAPPRA